MKPTLLFSSISPFPNYLIRVIVLLLIAVGSTNRSSAQCTGGYARDTINWDYLDFLHQGSGSAYSQLRPPAMTELFVTTAMAQTQYFNVAGNKITFANTGSPSLPIGGSGQVWGDLTTHSGEAGSFGVGEDVKFMPAVSPATYSISFSFQTAVRDVKFSVYDIDYDQRITVTALNGATPVNITMAKISGTTLTINGSGTTSANAKAVTSPTLANTSTDGTANVTISGLVTSFTITVSETGIKLSGSATTQDDGGFFLSDISACFAISSFPTNYYQPYTEPFTGPLGNQPSYFLANPQNLHVYMVNPANAVAQHVFSDPGGTAGTKMNSLAYDPVNRWLYYVMDFSSSAPNNLALKKYDFNTNTISTVISSLPAFGIPCFIHGVELAAAAFYNGSLYLGIEGLNGGAYTGVESIVWKIDFNGSGTPTGFAQVFGTLGGTSPTSPIHDWGDIIIKDSILISHATISTLSDQYIHYNMQTGTATTYNNVPAQTAGQLGQTYNGNIYRLRDNVALYNNAGGFGAATSITVSSCSPTWATNVGDASDPFKPKSDFGDAPASYDPVALSPAVNDSACNNTTLRIGSAWGMEWSKNTSADASGDSGEDGVTTVTIMVSDGNAYNHQQDVTVLNNTGANAYLAAWLDYDADGLFEAGEGVVMTVASSATPQVISLGWTGITVPIGTPNSFLRVRLSSSVMTTSNATGWFSDGETEDYPVISQASPLTIRLLDLNATLTRDKNVLLNWTAWADSDALGFEVQRSKDQATWEKIGWVDINSSTFTADYSLTDQQPLEGNSYYRLKMIEKSGSSRYSSTRIIQLDRLVNKLNIYPNPVKKDITITFSSSINQGATLNIRSLSGKVVVQKTIGVIQGNNQVSLSSMVLPNGIYIAELITPEKTLINRLTVAH